MFEMNLEAWEGSPVKKKKWKDDLSQAKLKDVNSAMVMWLNMGNKVPTTKNLS